MQFPRERETARPSSTVYRAEGGTAVERREAGLDAAPCTAEDGGVSLAQTLGEVDTGCPSGAIAPGTLDTGFQGEPGNRALWETWVDRIPVKRIGRPAASPVNPHSALLRSDECPAYSCSGEGPSRPATRRPSR